MNFKNIGIIDDSIGGLEILERLKKTYNENYIYIAGLKEYPYSLRKIILKEICDDLYNKALSQNIKMLIVTNPYISQFIDSNDVEKIDGIEMACKSLSDKNILMLGSEKALEIKMLNKYFNKTNSKKVNAQILMNMPHDGDRNSFIVSKLISEYIGDYEGDVFLFDSNLSLFKDEFKRYNENLNIYTLNDFIYLEFVEKFKDELKTYSKNKTRIKYLVTDHRIAFYSSAEEFFDERFSTVRKIK